MVKLCTMRGEVAKWRETCEELSKVFLTVMFPFLFSFMLSNYALASARWFMRSGLCDPIYAVLFMLIIPWLMQISPQSKLSLFLLVFCVLFLFVWCLKI